MKQSKPLGYASIITSAVIFGLAPFLASLAYDEGFSGMGLSFFRSLIAAPVVAIYMLIRGDRFRVSLRDGGKILFLSLTGSLLTSVFLFCSYQHIDTSIATTLNFSYPVIVLVLETVIYKAKVSRNTLICLVLCMAGIVLFMNPTAGFTWRGFFLALGSGVTYGLYVLYIDRSRILESVPLSTFTFWYFAFTAILMAPFMMIPGVMNTELTLKGFFWAAVFSLSDGVLGSVCVQYGVRQIGSVRSSLLSAVEPVTSVIAGILILGETATVTSLLGVICILGATTYLILSQKKNENL